MYMPIILGQSGSEDSGNEQEVRLFRCKDCQRLIIGEDAPSKPHPCRANGRTVPSFGHLETIAVGKPSEINAWAISILQGLDKEFKGI